jgi:hypothetical protein
MKIERMMVAGAVGLFVSLALLMPKATMLAQAPVRTTAAFQPVSHDTLSVSSTALGLSAADLSPAGVGKIQGCLVGPIEGNNVRIWLDGTVPTSSTGHLFQVGQSFTLESYGAAVGFLVIAATGTATIPVTCSH